MEDYSHQYPSNGSRNMQYTAQSFYAQNPAESMQQFAYYSYPSSTNPAYAYKHHMYGASYSPAVYNEQNAMNHHIRQDGPKNDVLNELDMNSHNLSRSSSACSTNLMDLTHSKRSSASPMSVDENFNNYSQIPPPVRHLPSGANIKITDLEYNPLIREDNQQMNNCVNDTQLEDRDLSNNYVYRILSRTWSGKVELRKQQYFEEKMKKQEASIIALPYHVSDDEAQEDSENENESEEEDEEEEDDSMLDSLVDDYEIELVDKLNRNKICELVMEYEVDHFGYLPSKERLYFMRDSLVEVFKFEDKDVWLGKSEEGVIKGRFKNKLKALREIATKWGMWKSPYVRPKKSEVAAPVTKCLPYFKGKKEVDNECRQKWKEFEIEKIEYFKSASIPRIACDIPFLFKKDGIDLLVKDHNARHEGHEQFEAGHQNKGDRFSKNCSEFAPLILKIAHLKVKDARRKKELKAILNDPKNKALKSQDHIENLALVCLPFILGPVQCTIKKQTTNSWKASALEAQESFIIHVNKELTESAGEKEIDKKSTALEDLFGKHNLPLNPYVIAYGDLNDIKYCYVVINDYKHRIDGPKCLVKAVDVCFKCTSALYKQPPKPASYAWQFLKKQIYGQRVDGAANPVIQMISSINTVKIKPVAPKKRKRNGGDLTKVTKRANQS